MTEFEQPAEGVASRPRILLNRMAMAVVCAALTFASLLVGAGTAAAASGCSTPVSTRPLDSSNSYLRGAGRFTCNNVYGVETRVELSYKLIGSQSYTLVTANGYVPRGTIGASQTWSTFTAYTRSKCGFWMVRSFVRFKYSPSSAFTYRDRIATWSPCA